MKYGLLTEAAFGLPSVLTAHTGKPNNPTGAIMERKLPC